MTGPDAPRTGIARAAGTDPLTARGILAAVGGPLGVVESVVPTLVFVVLYQVAAIRIAPRALPRADLLPIVLVPVALCVVLVLYRVLRRQSVRTAVGGAVVVAISAVLTLVSGDANANYLPGFLINGAYLAAMLVSLAVRRPLIGVVIGALMGDREWRGDRARRRLYAWLTALWCALFAIRLAVEVPLYLAGDQVVALGIARIVLGLPLYALVLVVTVLAVQASRRSGAPGGDILTDGSSRGSRGGGPGTKERR